MVDEESDPENLLEGSDFNTVWEVLQAMIDQDQRLEAIVSQLRTMQGEGKEATGRYSDLMAEFKDHVEVANLPKRIEYPRFTQTLYTKIIEINAKSWDFWFGLTLRYKEQYGTPNAPLIHINSDGFNLGAWQGGKRNQFKANKLSLERVKRFEDIGFTWDILEEAFEKGFKETVKYKEQYGTPNAPRIHITSNGFKLGAWQSNQRANYKANKLSAERTKKLEEIGFLWDQLEEAFETGFKETFKYKQQYGTPNAPNSYVTAERFKLATWQQNQRRRHKANKLSAERTKKLEEIGFLWDQLEEAFETGFKETFKYKQQYGTPNAPQLYVASDGFNLGSWQSNQRAKYKGNKVPSDRVKRLEDIGFTWDILEEAFEKGYEETLKYKEQFGTAHVSRSYVNSDGFNLATWQQHQRMNYKTKKLSADRVKRLEEIGFTWKPYKEAFEKGIEETVKYKEQYGTPNAPQSYINSDGFKLGIWQGVQKKHYKRNKLSPERIRQLEEIGFTWDILEEAFEKGIEEIIKYKEQHGSANAPRGYVTSDGFRLGSWQNNNRTAYKANRLSLERIKRLEEIGFKWKVTK